LVFSKKAWTRDARIAVAKGKRRGRRRKKKKKKRVSSLWSASGSFVVTRASAWLWERGVIWDVEMWRGEGMCAWIRVGMGGREHEGGRAARDGYR
jgi:hypothetical protein